MTTTAVEFEDDGDQLILVYRPRDGTEWVLRKFEEKGELVIKGTFHFSDGHLVAYDQRPFEEGAFLDAGLGNPDNFDEPWLAFKIGSSDGDYFRLDPTVLGIEIPVLLSKNAPLTWRWFSTDRPVSILSVIAELKPSRIVIGGSEPDAIPVSEYKKLIDQFPTPYEVRRYVQARVSAVVRQYSDAKVDAEAKLNAYVNKRVLAKGKDLFKPVRQAEIAKYEFLLEQLQEMLDSEDGYSETAWQKEIIQIVCLLNPKYIAAFPEVPILDSDSETHRFLDFLLVDASGNIDVVEIKRPFAKGLITSTTYRDNHIATRDLSGTVMQIEKYLRHLNRWGTKGEAALRKRLGNKLPPDFQIKITNPCGVIIMGREKGLTNAQLRDLEVTRRHYKHIADIVTYDELLRRLRFILEQLRAEDEA
ncbi:Shedu immune nuclease family protein [Pseudomonas sp. A2]|uniref:Shedu immune nuclease family protein n=1 Tax=Pseudomonas sp. A2 TaxID=107445 RepID=UPI002CBEF292|nr:Shedu immune nuclease family protein [Pseudomonas sp. A2]MEB3438110.1 Shedu immune nuclease family protein [Pseudomonas sp. A2]